MQLLSRTLACLPLLFALGSASAQETSSAVLDHLEERLQYLAQDLESERVNNDIPGMAVALVHDGELIFAQGFGVADLESGRKVKPETNFAIGSTTKAFTSVLVGMLVDEGRMDWDAPITDYLPYFKLKLDSKQEDDQATLRDLLCHRTGFTRMGLLWASGLTSREETLRTATQAEPWSPFRKRFFYNNVMYLAAGEAAGKVSGLGWDGMLKERLFKPLGMNGSNSDYASAMADKGMALGYSWQKDLGVHKREQMRNIDTIGPAGSINSNVLDMSRWIRFQLAQGEFEGQRLMSEFALTDTWEDNIRVQGSIKYGMGWMRNQYHGEPALHHGGNIDGFAAAVALLPESKLGYVLLTNISATPLQAPTSTLVWDAMLKDFEPRLPKEATDSSEFEPFLGVYIANFASFKDAEFTVSARQGALFLDIPGQLNGELLPADEEGLRAFKLVPGLQIRFVEDEAGKVDSLELHQGGASFEMFRPGHEFELDLPLAELEGFLGKYQDEAIEKPLVVTLQNGHLAVDVPGQMIFEMNPPNEEGIWMFRAVPGIGVEFEYDDEGRVSAMIRHQGGQDSRCERLEDQAESALPSLAEIDELRHAKSQIAALAKAGNLRFQADIRFVHTGIQGSLESVETPDGRFLQHTKMGKFGESLTGFDGTTGWISSSFDEYEEPQGILLDQLRMTPVSTFLGDWKQSFDRVRVLREDSSKDGDFWVLEFTRGKLPPMTAFLDKQTGDICRLESMILSSSGISVPVENLMSEFSEVAGLRLPHRVVTQNDQSGRTEFSYQDVETQVELKDEIFKPRK